MNITQNTPLTIQIRWSKLGYKPETIKLIFLVPLIQVAWAEGYLQRSERKMILRFAGDLEIKPETEEYELLNILLDERPLDEFFTQAANILKTWLDLLPANESEKLRETLHDACLKVAKASPEIGMHRNRRAIRREEEEQLVRLTKNLGFSFVH
jgi:hypothetical protein